MPNYECRECYDKYGSTECLKRKFVAEAIEEKKTEEVGTAFAKGAAKAAGQLAVGAAVAAVLGLPFKI